MRNFKESLILIISQLKLIPCNVMYIIIICQVSNEISFTCVFVFSMMPSLVRNPATRQSRTWVNTSHHLLSCTYHVRMPQFCNFISYNSELVNESSGIQVLSLLDALGLFLRIPTHILEKLSDKIVYLLHVFLVLFLLSGFLVCFWFVCLGGGGGVTDIKMGILIRHHTPASVLSSPDWHYQHKNAGHQRATSLYGGSQNLQIVSNLMTELLLVLSLKVRLYLSLGIP